MYEFYLLLSWNSGSYKMTRSSSGRFNCKRCGGTLGMRNFFGITPPHVFVRNPWPLVDFGESGSIQARFGGDSLLIDFRDESKLSSRFLLFNATELFSEPWLLAYEITDGRLLATDEQMSFIDCDSFGFSNTLLTVGDDADKYLFELVPFMLFIDLAGRSMDNPKLLTDLVVLLCPISFKFRRLDWACISFSLNPTENVLTVLRTEQMLVSPSISFSSFSSWAFAVSCKSFSMLW